MLNLAHDSLWYLVLTRSMHFHALEFNSLQRTMQWVRNTELLNG
jgi:hypothetical protein